MGYLENSVKIRLIQDRRREIFDKKIIPSVRSGTRGRARYFSRRYQFLCRKIDRLFAES